MTPEKIMEVIGIYRAVLDKEKVGKIDYPHDTIVMERNHALAHCNGMLEKMEAFINEGRIDKAFRWLGFVQGVLWREGLYCLEELKKHNMP